MLSADLTEDTDEFDQHVIAHEFGHYIEDNFSRADNIGGAHGLGDKLDIRVAFGEGFGYAFSAIVLDDPVAIDTFVDNGAQVSSTFDVEDNPPPRRRRSTTRLLVQRVIGVVDPLGSVRQRSPTPMTPWRWASSRMWNVLINSQRTTPAFTSLFSFISALKTANPASAAAIDTLVTAQNTSTIADIWGTGETHVPTPRRSSGRAARCTRRSPSAGRRCTLRNVNDAGTYNTLGNHRYLRFKVASTRNITVTASSSNPMRNTGYGFPGVARRGRSWPSARSTAADNPETETINAPPGTYVIDVYDCANGCAPTKGARRLQHHRDGQLRYVAWQLTTFARVLGATLLSLLLAAC